MGHPAQPEDRFITPSSMVFAPIFARVGAEHLLDQHAPWVTNLTIPTSEAHPIGTLGDGGCYTDFPVSWRYRRCNGHDIKQLTHYIY